MQVKTGVSQQSHLHNAFGSLLSQVRGTKATSDMTGHTSITGSEIVLYNLTHIDIPTCDFSQLFYHSKTSFSRKVLIVIGHFSDTQVYGSSWSPVIGSEGPFVKFWKVSGWFAGKCLISGPDTLRSYKQENRNGGKFLSVDLCSLRSYS